MATPAASGGALVDLALKHVGEGYVLGVLAPKDNPNWSGPWDCAEFASWLIFQLASVLYGCDRDFGDPSSADAYTGVWARDARSLGVIISVEQAARTPGAAVLRIPQVAGIGHIVISEGNGRTIEAHSSADGVVELSLAQRRWDCGILVPGLTYSEGTSVVVDPPAGAVFRLTVPTMHGKAVERIQQLLRDAGFDPGDVDGIFAPHTQAAAVAFQLSKGLAADGEVGPVTMKALRAFGTEKPQPRLRVQTRM